MENKKNNFFSIDNDILSQFLNIDGSDPQFRGSGLGDNSNPYDNEIDRDDFRA
jgi:hypothetical protein